MARDGFSQEPPLPTREVPVAATTLINQTLPDRRLSSVCGLAAGAAELAGGRPMGKRGPAESIRESWMQGLGGNSFLRMVYSSPATSSPLVPLLALTFFSSVVTHPRQVPN